MDRIQDDQPTQLGLVKQGAVGELPAEPGVALLMIFCGDKQVNSMSPKKKQCYHW